MHPRIELLDLTDGKTKPILEGASVARYLPSGHLLYHKRGELLAVPFDLERLEIRGTPGEVVQGVAFSSYRGALSAQFDVSRNGTLVYRSGGSISEEVSLQWLDAAGKTQPTVVKPAEYGRPRLSPDGRLVAVRVQTESGSDIWTYDLHRGNPTRLTFDGKSDSPIWTPDSRFIAFRLLPRGGMSWMRGDGSSAPQPLISTSRGQFPYSFTRDQKRIAFMEEYTAAKYHLWAAPVENVASGLRMGAPEPFFQSSKGDERHPAFSPDGRWLAYTSDESGDYQVWVRPFPPNPSGGKWQVSHSGGMYPIWSANTGELFFRTEDNQVMVASYAVHGDSFVSETPREWSKTQLANIGPNANYDVAPDGKRIIAVLPAPAAEQKPQHHVVFLLNFFDELRRRVPVPGKP